jgi:hypothetical protein
MRPLFHPAIEDVRPEAILHALADPDRAAIFAGRLRISTPWRSLRINPASRSTLTWLDSEDFGITRSVQDPYGRLMRPLFHPAIEDVRPEAILHALADPDRINPASRSTLTWLDSEDFGITRSPIADRAEHASTQPSPIVRNFGTMATEFKTPTDG